ncbi:mitochondrial 37S ribosomal protein mS42 [Calcarisporiella thermophila]|uniref:mitochondrial 37S ribosomal protein mS42 n=1 Tax=Calcarisporiella thermophila TaxID=911321 RepID=UPI003742D3D5
MSYKLPSLPYDYTALEPFVDTTTMHLHHEKHHQTYINNLNAALANVQGTDASDILAIQRAIAKLPAAVRNNGGGHYNHSLFWTWMCKPGESNTKPTGTLARKIDEDFGSFENLKKDFSQAAITRFGSGWAWLGVDQTGKLAVTSTPNQDNPLMAGVVDKEVIPILGLDVWEHAYYLKYQNRRPEYVENWWNVVNWDKVVEYYEQYASKGQAVPLA